jgi:hypothetical protein
MILGEESIMGCIGQGKDDIHLSVRVDAELINRPATHCFERERINGSLMGMFTKYDVVF